MKLPMQTIGAVMLVGALVTWPLFKNSAAPIGVAWARYNSNGSLDTTFEGDGKVGTDFSGVADDLALAADGKIVVAGHASVEQRSQFALARYNSNGSPDTTFGNGGKVITGFLSGQSAVANAIAIAAGGKFVVAGNTRTNSGRNFALARYNPNGSLDTAFGANGKVITDIPTNPFDEVQAIAIAPNGKIVAAGFTATIDRSQVS